MSAPVADLQALENHIRMQLLRAIRDVVAPKMIGGQLQFRDLGEGRVAQLMPEFIAASGLAQNGVQIGNLTMRFQIDNAPMQQAAPQQQQAPQHEVQAHIHVGGLNINASSAHGLDTAGLQNQLKDKAKSQIVWYGIGCGILLLVILFIGGLGIYIYRSATIAGGPSGSTAVAAKWDGKSPFTCSGNDNVRLEGVTAKLSATAITASANCHLTLVSVDVSGATGIEAGGNAVVTVQGGSITGTTFAVHATMNAKVDVTGTKVSGKTQAVGVNAKITGV
jgi:hypothetical protein